MPQPGDQTIAIVTDGAADVPAPERRGVAWTVLPDVWRGAGLEVRDFGEQSRDLTRLVLASGGPGIEAAAPGFDDFVQAYTQHREADRIFSIHASANISTAVEAAREAAGGFPNVRVIETSVAGIGVGLLAVRARDLFAEGGSLDDIESFLRSHAKTTHFLVVPDRFDPLAGQRMSTARLLAGRPLLSSRDGSFARSRRLRSRKQTVAAIERYLAVHAPRERGLRIAVGHGDAAGAVDPFLDIVERLRPNAQVELVGRIGPRLVERVGTRCVGLAWVVE